MNKQAWLEKTEYWKNKWNTFQEQSNLDNDEFGIDLYKFTEILNDNLDENSIIIGDAGSVGYVLSQGLQLKQGARFILDCNQMAMNACISMSGVALASNKKIICVVGDSSFTGQINALTALKYHNLSVIIYLWNNGGSLSIANTADSFYNGRKFGTDSTNGLFFPN